MHAGPKIKEYYQDFTWKKLNKYKNEINFILCGVLWSDFMSYY